MRVRLPLLAKKDKIVFKILIMAEPTEEKELNLESWLNKPYLEFMAEMISIYGYRVLEKNLPQKVRV